MGHQEEEEDLIDWDLIDFVGKGVMIGIIVIGIYHLWFAK